MNCTSHTREFHQEPNINTICLPNPERGISQGICRSMGWGTNDQTDKDGVNIMKQVVMNQFNNASARQKCEDDILATNRQVSLSACI